MAQYLASNVLSRLLSESGYCQPVETFGNRLVSAYVYPPIARFCVIPDFSLPLSGFLWPSLGYDPLLGDRQKEDSFCHHQALLSDLYLKP